MIARGVGVGRHRGSLRQPAFDRLDQAFGVIGGRALARCQRRGAALGREARAMQRLAHVDIAEAGDDLLIRQCRLEARLFAGARVRQHGGIERVAERLRADLAHERMFGKLAARHQ